MKELGEAKRILISGDGYYQEQEQQDFVLNSKELH